MDSEKLVGLGDLSDLIFFRFAFIRVNPRLNFKLTHYRRPLYVDSHEIAAYFRSGIKAITDRAITLIDFPLGQNLVSPSNHRV